MKSYNFYNSHNTHIRWEAFKAYIRGVMISYTSCNANTTHLLMTELEQDIKDLERELSVNNTPENLQRLSTVRAKYNEITASKALNSITRLKQSYYDQGESADKLLASVTPCSVSPVFRVSYVSSVSSLS